MSKLVTFLLIVAVSAAFLGPAQGQTINSEWDFASGNWNVATNWLPSDVPDNGGGMVFNVQIGNRAFAQLNTVTLIPEDGLSDTVNTLSITNAAKLDTNGFGLIVVNQTTVDGSFGDDFRSSIIVDPHSTPGVFAFETDNLDINNNASVLMNGGTLGVQILLEINDTSTLTGFGTVFVGDADAVAEQAMENTGTIRVNRPAIGGGPLTLDADGVDTIDLDGDGENGAVHVTNAAGFISADSLELIVNAPLSDSFGGSLLIGQRDTATFNHDFEMDAANVGMNGGNNTARLGGTGAITSVANTTFSFIGNTVIGNDMTFSGTSNVLTVNASSTLTLNGTVTIPDASAINLSAASAALVIGGNTTITEAAGDFNWDGTGVSITTINDGGSLELAVDQVDMGNDLFNGTLNLNGDSDVSVLVTAPAWTLAGVLNKNTVTTTSNVNGDAVLVTGDVNVNAGTLMMNGGGMTFASGSDLNVAAGAVADMIRTTLGAGSNIHIDGTLRLAPLAVIAGPATLDGSGSLRLMSDSTITANTTVNVNTFDWDGDGVGASRVINDGVTLTINSPVFDSDGDVDGPVTLGGNSGRLIVNGPASWQMRNTFTSNPTNVGGAIVGGTSRMVLTSASAILNVAGNTSFEAPLTVGPSSTVDIAAGAALSLMREAIYDGGTITGDGIFNPNFTGTGNTVASNSTINVANFNFDGGGWFINPGATLTVNVADYDSDSATNDFTSDMTINSGTANVNTGDVSFVMNGTLNLNNTAGAAAVWAGETLVIGNDVGSLDANLNVGGTGTSRIDARVQFNADADVLVPAGTTLLFTNRVDFLPVNGINNASFMGEGTLAFSSTIDLSEATTLNMTGGTVDLNADGGSANIGLEAPLVINAATLVSLGGTADLNVDNRDAFAETGTLTVNLPTDVEWTTNAGTELNFINDNIPATLLSGSDVNINGRSGIGGDVRWDARVDIGATGVVDITTAGEPLRLSGGNTTDDANTIAGGTINGPGILGADNGSALVGFGMINADVDFDGNASLKANDGTLHVNGVILDVNQIGTSDVDGVLDVANAWNTNVAASVVLQGGELSGSAITNDTPQGISGFGLISAKLINNTRVSAQNGTLVIEQALGDNNWDGTSDTGTLDAMTGDLEVRDSSTFLFHGTVATGIGDFFANGFELEFEPGSTLRLGGGTRYRSTDSTDIGGMVIMQGGTATLQISGTAVFEATSSTSLTGNIELNNDTTIVEAGATFSGPGDLINLGHRQLTLNDNANVGVGIENRGTMDLNLEGIARVEAAEFRQTAGGLLNVDLAGTIPDLHDRILPSGAVQLDGTLDVDLGSSFNPALNDIFTIIDTLGGVTGTFANIIPPTLNPGLALSVIYHPTRVVLAIVSALPGDYNQNGMVDAADYVLWRKTLGQMGADLAADGNGNNQIDPGDYDVWRANFGRTAGSGNSAGVNVAVPEPMTLVLLIAGMLVTCSRRVSGAG